MHERLNEYRIMWLIVFFDLPTQTKIERKKYALFRTALIEDGFTMYQYSVYIRCCPSMDNAEVHKRRVRNMVSVKGFVSMLCITDKQFASIETIIGKGESTTPPDALPLEFF